MYANAPPPRPPHLSSDNLVHESVNVPSGEGVSQGCHLVNTASQGPDVRLVVVRLVGKELGAHVVRRPDDRVSEVAGPVQHSSDAKITDLGRPG